jgi:hypothetical protein
MRCQVCGDIEITRSIHEGVAEIEPCPHDGYVAKRIWEAPYAQEDRLRMWRNQYGTRHSFALGEEMPESRRDLRRIERQRGIEFTSELTPQERTIMDYRKHVDTGGERLTSEQVNPQKIENRPLRDYIPKGFKVEQ